MDVHVPAAIMRGLRRRDVDVLTSQDDNTTRMPDDELLKRATLLDRTLFTMDEDLLSEANRLQRLREHFSGVIYAHQLGVTIGQCVTDLELMAKIYEPDDMV